MKEVYIKGISYYLPEQVYTNNDLVRDFPEWSVDKVMKKVGVEERHLAAENETAGDMAEKAARRLFEEYRINPTSIDFLLLCTQSPDYLRHVLFRIDWVSRHLPEHLITIWAALVAFMEWLWQKASLLLA